MPVEPGAFQVIPAIDLLDGQCVRLVQGDYARKTVYSDDPVSVARRWESEGATRIHVVDLDGARTGEPVNLPTASRIASAVNIPCDFGGGVRSVRSAESVLAAGFRWFSIGTKALDGDFAAEIFGEYPEAAILDVAAREGRVKVGGWTQDTEELAVELALRMKALGCRQMIFTDIARDGSLEGPNTQSVQSLARNLNIPVVASGGVSTLEDIAALARLAPDGVAGVITGKALYDGRLKLPDAIAAARKVLDSL